MGTVGVHIVSKLDDDIIQQFLVQEDGTAILHWMFVGVGADNTVTRRVLVAQLTEEEAKAIYERNAAEVGILEPIRHNMTFPDAKIMFVRKSMPYSFDTVDIQIPHEGSEEEFLNVIDSVTSHVLNSQIPGSEHNKSKGIIS